MALLEGQELKDIQNCFFGLFSYLEANTAPWTSWSVKKGWPDKEIKAGTLPSKKPILWVELPIPIEDEQTQQGGRSLYWYAMRVGVITDTQSGGPLELGEMISRVLALFRNPQTLHSDSIFNVTINNVAIVGTNLITQGIRVQNITGREIETEDPDRFRYEFIITLYC